MNRKRLTDTLWHIAGGLSVVAEGVIILLAGGVLILLHAMDPDSEGVL